MQTLSIDQLAGQTLGNYRIERFLGRGRLNAIYLARNLAEEQRLDALTVYRVPERFSSEARTRFLLRFHKEASMITLLEHPHILPVYDHGEIVGNPYLVTPYMTHGSLADLLKQHGKYNYSSVLPILEQLGSGLAYAHGKGFIHGTLRPSTIVLSPENTLRVAGFGLMHMLQLSGIESNENLNTPYAHLLSIAETFLISPEYVAPEVVQGQSIDARSDIYALGCILFELLSGKPPFTGKDPLDIINRQVKGVIPLLNKINPDIPIALTSVVNHALERDPARRFQHILELMEAFRQASRGAVNHPMPETVRETKVPKPTDDTSQNAHSSNKWQLVPPIVTGKHSAVQIGSENAFVAEMPTQSIDTDPVRAVKPPVTGQFPSVTTGKVPSTMTSVPQEAKPSLVPEQKVIAEMPTQSINRDSWRAMQASVSGKLPMMPNGNAPSVGKSTFQQENGSIASKEQLSGETRLQSGNVKSGSEDLSSLVNAYSWWSLPGIVSPPEPQTKPTPPARPEVPRQSLRLDNLSTDQWENGASLPSSVSPKSDPKSNISARKVKRRSVVALLATSGVAAAVGAVALNLGTLQHILGMGSNQAHTPSNPTNSTETLMSSQTQANRSTVIGKTTLTPNSAADFKNPVDGQDSLLIHLPNNQFVAYEKACTHQQVSVYYNPTTKQLVCPAHGAIFDPAKGGAVVQGPATKPLSSVKISVNGDGTIMAG